MTTVVSSDIKNLFEVPLMVSSIFLPHELIAKHVIEYCGYANDYTTYHDSKINREWFDSMPNKQSFTQAVEALVEQYVKSTGRQQVHNNFKIHPWGSVWAEGQTHQSHIHRHCVLAGTYYPQANDSSAPITFESPWHARCMADTIDNKRLFYRHAPRTGDLLLWPAWLRHYVKIQGKQTQPTRPRVAISFNITYN